MIVFRFALALVFCASAVWGQTVVEHSVGTAASSGAAAGASGAGGAIGGVFGNLSKLAEKAGKDAPKPAVSAAKISSNSEALKPIQTSPIDPALVSIGLMRAELIERCGEPSTSVKANGVETMAYETTAHDLLEVKLTDGKVVSFAPASRKKRPPVAVMLP